MEHLDIYLWTTRGFSKQKPSDRRWFANAARLFTDQLSAVMQNGQNAGIIWEPKRAHGKYVPVQPNRSCTHVAAHWFGHGGRIVWRIYVTRWSGAGGVSSGADSGGNDADAEGTLRFGVLVNNRATGAATHLRRSRL